MAQFTSAQEANFLNREDIGFRLDLWGYGKEKYNILLVTGHSGSGKTTLARDLVKKHQAIMISLDWFDWYMKAVKPKDDPDYPAWKFYTDCIRSTGNTTDPMSMEYQERRVLFEKSFKTFRKCCERKSNQLYVVEGIQIINLMTNMPDPQELPIICKGTSAAVSAMRKYNRDGGARIDDAPAGRLKTIIEWMGIEKTNRRFMARLNATGTPQVVSL